MVSNSDNISLNLHGTLHNHPIFLTFLSVDIGPVFNILHEFVLLYMGSTSMCQVVGLGVDNDFVSYKFCWFAFKMFSQASRLLNVFWFVTLSRTVFVEIHEFFVRVILPSPSRIWHFPSELHNVLWGITRISESHMNRGMKKQPQQVFYGNLECLFLNLVHALSGEYRLLLVPHVAARCNQRLLSGWRVYCYRALRVQKYCFSSLIAKGEP